MNLVMFLEGPRDQVFYDQVLRPILEPSYDQVRAHPYACAPTEETNDYLKNLSGAMANDYQYIFLADNDNAPCFSARANEIRRKFPALDHSRLVIVRREIEGWFVAGANARSVARMHIRKIYCEELTKEQFLAGIPKAFESAPAAWYVELAKGYQYNKGCANSVTLAYFDQKVARLIGEFGIGS